MEIQEVKIADLVEDLTVFPRTQTGGPRIQRMADAMAVGVEFPPIVVCKKSLRIVDGFGRVRASKALERETIQAEVRIYKNDSDLLQDAYRLNADHGTPLTPYEIKRGVERFKRMGVKDARIVEILRVPQVRVLEIESRFGVSDQGQSMALKGSAAHLAQQQLTKSQTDAHPKLSGMNVTFHVRQVILALESGVWRDTDGLRLSMTRLIELWEEKIQMSA